MRRLSVILITLGMVFAGAATASASAPESADVWEQGLGAVYAPNGASIVRQPNGLVVSVTMPTPASGTYVYPAGVEPGHPEVFTMWLFIFNHPENCSGPCGPDDMTNPAVEFGVYNVAGHVVGGPKLTLTGRAGVGEPAGAPPGVVPHDLSNPAGAEVHMAVTSHGQLDASTLPDEFRVPTGNGACGCWWLAFF